MFKLTEQERTAGLWETDNCKDEIGKMAMKRNLAEIWLWQ